MKNANVFYIITILCILSSCIKKGEVKVQNIQEAQVKFRVPEHIDALARNHPVKSINIDKYINGKDKLSLKGEIDSISYIKLVNNVPFAHVMELVMTKDYLFINTSNDAGIHQYTRSGEFVRKFAEKGNGPGESNIILRMSVDETNERVYITQLSKSPLIYSFKGEFLGNLEIYPDISYLYPLTDSLFSLFGKVGSKKNNSDYFGTGVYSLNGDMVYSKYEFTSYYNPISNYEEGYVFNALNDGLEVKANGNDTVFLYRTDSIIPLYVLESADESIYYNNMFETKNYFWVKFDIAKKGLFSLSYNKYTGDIMCQKNLFGQDNIYITEMSKGIFNDIDDGPPVWPQWSFPDQKVLAQYMLSSEIIDLEEEKYFKGKPAGLRDIKPEDNPVIVLFHLNK